jgi:hypothetical protein
MDESIDGDAANIVAAYDFGRTRTIVDIAGGRGILLAAILIQEMDIQIGRVLELLEGGLRIPAIISWPARISQAERLSSKILRNSCSHGEVWRLQRKKQAAG